jgi:hypothetical protein
VSNQQAHPGKLLFLLSGFGLRKWIGLLGLVGDAIRNALEIIFVVEVDLAGFDEFLR